MSELTRSQIAEICQEFVSENLGAQPIRRSNAIDVATTSDVEATIGATRLVLPDDLIKRITAALKQGHVRLIGPPGTGKSTLARAILEAAVGDDHVFAVATGQWTGEDVIGGPMPDPREPSSLVFRPGFILSAADAGKWVGIDEMNRADIDAAFGELFGLLAGFDLDLPYTSDPSTDDHVKIYAVRPAGELDPGQYGVPADWRMVATMNSWDKLSLNRVSFAFSRRWCTVFLPVPSPDEFSVILDDVIARYAGALTPPLNAALTFLFVTETDESEVPTLRSLGLAMGPGLAVSCVKDIAAMTAEGIDEASAFSHAIDGFLLPQFEGALEQHEDLAKCLTRALHVAGATSTIIDTLPGRLGVFTGHRASTYY